MHLSSLCLWKHASSIWPESWGTVQNKQRAGIAGTEGSSQDAECPNFIPAFVPELVTWIIAATCIWAGSINIKVANTRLLLDFYRWFSNSTPWQDFMTGYPGKTVCSEIWLKEGSSCFVAGVEKNTADFRLPLSISTEEHVNILHTEISHRILFGF